MNKILVALLIVLSPFLCSAEKSSSSIVGRAVDSTSKKGVPFATISVLDSKGKILKQLASDGNGIFEVALKPPLSGTIELTAIGYKMVKMKFSINPNSARTDLGDIVMTESSTNIGQVTIQAQRQIIKIEADKISYSPEADPESQVLSTLDLMRKVPLISIDIEDNIKLKGSSSYKILINGKESPLMNNNAKDVLKGIPASSIKNIEVITNPPSKYSAEGIGGLINIITHKKSISGFSGNATLRGDNLGGYGGSFYSNANIGKFAFSINYGNNKRINPTLNNYTTTNNSSGNEFRSSIEEGWSKKSSTHNFINGEMSYEIDSLNLISATFYGYSRNYWGDDNTTTSMYFPEGTTNKLVKQFTNSYSSNSSWGSFSSNLDYQRSFKKPDKLFTVSYKFDMVPSKDDFYRTITGVVDYPSSRSRSKNNAGTYENTFQLDYVNPISKIHQYEIGTRYILRTNPSNIEYLNYDAATDAWQTNKERNNDLNYSESIIAAYFGYMLRIAKYSFKAGARYEGSYINASYTEKTIDKTFNSNFTDIVPYLTLSYNLNDISSIKIAYTQRLQRPKIWQLNPYIYDQNPILIYYGNPKLRTEKVNYIDLGYNYFSSKFSADISLFTRLNNNAVQTLIKTEPTGIQSQTYGNTGKNNVYGITIYSSYTPTPSFSVNTDFGTEYYILTGTTAAGSLLKKTGWTSYVNGNIKWTFLSSFTLSGFGFFNTGWVSLYNKGNQLFHNGISLRKDFLDKKLALTIALNNPFQEKQIWRFKSVGTDFSSLVVNESVIRTINLSLTYNFGKIGQSVKKAARSIKNEDSKEGSNRGGGEK